MADKLTAEEKRSTSETGTNSATRTGVPGAAGLAGVHLSALAYSSSKSLERFGS